MNYDLSGLEKKDVKERNHLNIMSVYSIDILFRHFHIFHNYYTENVSKSNSNAIRKGKNSVFHVNAFIIFLGHTYCRMLIRSISTAHYF